MYVPVVVVHGAAASVSALIGSHAFYVIVTGFCAELLSANHSWTHH